MFRSSNRGNFIELLQWGSSTDPISSSILNDAAKNSAYLSPGIQHELIALMAEHVRKKNLRQSRLNLMYVYVQEIYIFFSVD